MRKASRDREAQLEYGKLRCHKCAVVQDITEFYASQNNNYCKTCQKNYEKNRRKPCVYCEKTAFIGEFCHEHWRSRRDQVYTTFPELIILRKIGTIIANYYGVTVDEYMLGQNRSSTESSRRMLGYLVMKDATGATDEQIGLVFDRSPTSITHSRRKGHTLLMTDAKFRFDITEIWSIVEQEGFVKDLQ
jgi:hypothetical protein